LGSTSANSSLDNKPPSINLPETERHIRYNYNPSRPHCLSLPSFPFIYISRLALLDNTYQHKAVTMRQPYALSFLSPSFRLTASLYSIPIADTPEITTTKPLMLSFFSSLCPSFPILFSPLPLLLSGRHTFTLAALSLATESFYFFKFKLQ
jgi:hypothetical protein